MTGSDDTKPTDDGEYRRTFCPPLRDPVRADNQPGLTPSHDWPARDNLPTTDPDE
jgi:hypothetical protein